MFAVFVRDKKGKEVLRRQGTMERTDPNGNLFAAEATPISAEKPKIIGQRQVLIPAGVFLNEAARIALLRKGHRFDRHVG